MFKASLRQGKRRPIPKVKGGPGKVKVGLPRGTDPEVLLAALLNHYGTRNIPERPFLDNAMRDHRAEYVAELRRHARAILNGDMSTDQALGLLGIKATADIKAEIAGMVPPPNDAGTVAKKGSASPLVEDGSLQRAITWRKA